MIGDMQPKMNQLPLNMKEFLTLAPGHRVRYERGSGYKLFPNKDHSPEGQW